ncbi:hypothetical protein L195_g013817 [Trifolium pratense]|uniref:Transmembrane protein n=1 Tax=Trifolium pratense TaxID=57577 RepID=A0A2K3PP66_TRIPR|nr:hypothetical protein L195_g013817 [Trifolium pratense]
MNYAVFDEEQVKMKMTMKMEIFFIKIIINFTNLIDEVPKPSYAVVCSAFTAASPPLYLNWGCKSFKRRIVIVTVVVFGGTVLLSSSFKSVFASHPWGCWYVTRFVLVADSFSVLSCTLVIICFTLDYANDGTNNSDIDTTTNDSADDEGVTYLEKDFQIFNQWSLLMISLLQVLKSYAAHTSNMTLTRRHRQ